MVQLFKKIDMANKTFDLVPGTVFKRNTCFFFLQKTEMLLAKVNS